jgi:hypothetical protein
MSDLERTKRPSYTESLRLRVRAASEHLPSTRIAEVLTAFARPAFAELGSDATLEEVRSALGVVVDIWNAHTLAMPAWGSNSQLERLAERVASGLFPVHMVDLFAVLSELRHEEPFASDPRFISAFEVTADASGRVHVTCEARVPTKRRAR